MARYRNKGKRVSRRTLTVQAVNEVKSRATRDVSESERLRHAIAAKFLGNRYAIHYELGLNKSGRLRADIIGLSMGGIVTIGEVKSSVSDFRKDRKWHKYNRYCHRFHFILNEKTYAKIKDEIPKGVGVYVVSDTNEIRSVQNCKQREMAPSFLQSILTRIAYRASAEGITKHVNALTLPSLFKQDIKQRIKSGIEFEEAYDQAFASLIKPKIRG